jgi:excisionase family DNA binding protein
MPGLSSLDLYSVREAAEFLSCSTESVRRLIRQRLLPACKVSCRWIRITRADLERFVAQTRKPSIYG